MNRIFIGVDGGGTKSTIRVEDEAGNLLGREIGGPGNVRLSVEATWQVVNNAIANILKSHSLDMNDNQIQLLAGMGLAGCEIKEATQAFLAFPHSLHTLLLTSDAHTTCLAAHKGQDGAIIIAGTGVVGYQIERGKKHKVGGWGFPLDDEGGGAWLGLQAVNIAVRTRDARIKPNLLAEKIYAHFAYSIDALLQFTQSANSTQYATLAPLVIESSREQDEIAINLLKQAASAIDHIAAAMEATRSSRAQPLACTLVGSITQFLKPYLSDGLQQRLCPAILTPDQGAMLLIREHALQFSGSSH